VKLTILVFAEGDMVHKFGPMGIPLPFGAFHLGSNQILGKT
jgi:hypothetical protein